MTEPTEQPEAQTESAKADSVQRGVSRRIFYRSTYIGGDGWTYYPVTVQISANCPKCGGPRGDPHHARVIEDGEVFDVDGWENPCGHLDSYEACFHEAKAATARIRDPARIPERMNFTANSRIAKTPPGSLHPVVGHPSNYQALRNNRKISSFFPCINTKRLVLYRGNERRASNPKPNKNMNQKVKILSEENGVTRVTEINGARMGDDLFIDRSDLGKPGDIIEVPEFWVEDFEGDAAKTYYREESK